MQFMMMVKANDDSEAGRPPPPALMARMAEYSAENAKTGVFVQGAGLMPSSMGARIHAAGGVHIEVLGSAYTGELEVRQIFDPHDPAHPCG